MTAIVGVLNKHAVALAADSAVTLGGGRKVLNSANKIFALSKYYPVAVAIYGNSEFIGTPWEIIIKEFRKKIGEESCPALIDYPDKFFKFLSENHYFCNEQESLQVLKDNVSLFYSYVLDRGENDGKKITDVLIDFEKQSPAPFLTPFSKDDKLYLERSLNKELEDICNELIRLGVQMERKRIINVLTSILTNDLPPASSGLVFVGYGENEYFPVLCHYNVGYLINESLTLLPKPPIVINKQNPSAICPFAQTDVMRTILEGVSPKTQKIFRDSLTLTFKQLTSQLANLIGNNGDVALADKIRNLDITPFHRIFTLSSSQAQTANYTRPFVQSVASLEKEDLADFAESLIRLTSLKRKVSLDQETVGGPVDVMVISKGDGIIRMKRKHYFDAGMNHQFFSNYFNY